VTVELEFPPMDVIYQFITIIGFVLKPKHIWVHNQQLIQKDLSPTSIIEKVNYITKFNNLSVSVVKCS